MASNRMERINEDLQREMAALLREAKDPRLHRDMLSVTSVVATKDLRYAKVYVSALDKSNEKEILRGLRSASGFFRHERGERLSLRYTPELLFEMDSSIEHGAKIADMLSKLEKGENEDADS